MNNAEGQKHSQKRIPVRATIEDYNRLLLENKELKARLKKFTSIQQNLIKANNTIDEQLELYKRFNYYINRIVETQTIQEFKAIVPEAVIDCFNVESAMVVFDSPSLRAIYSEGFNNTEDLNYHFQCVQKFLRSHNERKPVYFKNEHLSQCSGLSGYANLLCRKFEVPKDDYCFYIVSFVSQRHANHFELLSEDDLVVFDNFSEQMHGILRQRLASRNLEVAKEKYRSIIANMRLGLLEVDNEERILMTNQSFVEMSGYTEKELKGQIASDLLLNEASKKHMKNQNEERLERKTSVYEVNVVNKDGEERTWLISGAPNYDVDGNVKGSIGIHLDITEQKQTERHLQETNDNLKKINNELDTFVYRVSHDLRTPLVSILSLTELIQASGEDALGEKNIEMLTLISKSAQRLDDTIKEILNYSKNARKDLQLEELDVVASLASIVKDIQHVDAEIQFNFEWNGIRQVRTDKMRFETIVKNLLANAVKYHDPAKIHRQVDFSLSATNTHYHMTIADNGLGMTEEARERAFEMFYRGTSASKGTGLGLFIVKEMVDMLNGDIEITSALKKGTTFILKIPIP